ncbi:MAG: hypothetical protein DLM65_07830 [Candidatus Aeolococcus gillhamiae]|uniref:Uncharacterized protein n=1 Tax=Candidatus Aeolococcus gillhamiae TaxID=3127015 RepID=A0A2W5Z5E0_9BACT|nr:MAG: hypothetical protein DLM65_07830 [Candidatus Dormibacter sp. RRmetagenome_bin12]
MAWSTRGLLVVTGLLVALAGCDEQTPVLVTASPSRSSSTPASPQPTLNSNLKPMLHGLIDRDGPPAAALRNVVTNFVVAVNWSDLQPTPGDIVANNAIDQAMTTARRMNAVAGQTPVGIKIRLYTGVYAPAWAKQLGGPPVAVTAGALTGTVGRFWTDAFGAAYADLWKRLAARYDSVPEIREVTVSRCMTFYAETMIRDVEDPSTVQNLLSAGFTINADKSCISQEIQLGTVWHSTRIGVAFNPYQLVVGAGVHASDEDFTEQMMHYCRVTLGPQCVLENNSIRFPLQPGLYQHMYEAMILLGSPISFQTAALTRIGDLTTTLQWAASVGANAVELPKGYNAVPAATLASVVAALPVSKG